MIFVFGNGLSIGFDPRLTTAAITSRVVDSPGSEDTAVLRELAELGTPAVPGSTRPSSPATRSASASPPRRALRGASERAIQRQTDHRSLEILRRCIREGDRYADNASGMLGL